MIGPLLLIEAARKAQESEEEDGSILGFTFIPTSVPQITITVGLLAQCAAAPLLASFADRYGARRLIMAIHVVLGLSACLVSLAERGTDFLIFSCILSSCSSRL